MLRGSDTKIAYTRLYGWYRTNANAIDRVYGRRDAYSNYSKKLIRAMPSPNRASPADMSYIAMEVLTGLLEWAYHQPDARGVPMHQYARTIYSVLGSEVARRSRLSRFRNAYAHNRGF